MNERTFGNNYNKDLSTKEIAALVRKALKAQMPGYKFSTRYESFSGGTSIDVMLKAAPHKILNARWTEIDRINKGPEASVSLADEQRTISRYNERTNEAVGIAKGILNSYNHDGSESQSDYFDVKFYGFAGVDGQTDTEEREAIEGLVNAGYRNINWKE